MSALLATLKMVNAKRQNHADPIEFRRQKLIRKIDEQILLCQSVENGKAYVISKRPAVPSCFSIPACHNRYVST